MKIIYSSFFLLSSVILQGQYQSIFGNQQTEWNFISLYCDAGFVETYNHERDTIIKSVEYQIVNNWGLLRESNQNSKLWYRNFNDDEEILIFDLTLAIGDTFKINSQNFIVDSVYIENSLKVIEFDFLPLHCGFYERLKFIEGKGPNLGYKFSITANSFDTHLLRCQTKDSITYNYLEQFGFGEDCQNDLVSTKDIGIDGVQIFPNPFSEELSVKFKDNVFRTIEVYNLNGVNLYNRNTNMKTIQIDTGGLPKGMYIIRILQSEFVKTMKVIKEN